MRNYECSSSLTKLVKSLLNKYLCSIIECACRFIENEYCRVLKEYSCYTESLLLTARKLNPALSYLGIVSVFKCHYVIVNICSLCRLYHFFLGSIGSSVKNVFTDGSDKKEHVLLNYSYISSYHLKTHTTLLGNMCFVMTWYDFNDMCEWLFPTLFDVQDLLIGKTYSDSIRLKLWREKAVRDFGEDRADYQMRTISFIGERLVSAWIATNMKVIQISAVNPQP